MDTGGSSEENLNSILLFIVFQWKTQTAEFMNLFEHTLFFYMKHDVCDRHIIGRLYWILFWGGDIPVK